MAWYNTKGNESDTVISSRIRFARNISDYPFYRQLDNTSANEIIEKVKNADNGECKFIDFSSMDLSEANSYVENRYVSHEFAASSLPHALLLDEEKGIAVMICEEDHLRIQCIKSGLALKEAYDDICGIDDRLEGKLNIAYDEKLGYLTHCPTNLGTAMRASVMLFLPALTMNGQIRRLASYLPKIGFTIRGLYGEGSSSEGSMYQISNRVTLGLTEEDIIAKLEEAVRQIIAAEKKARDILRSDNSDSLCDKIMRSYGIMCYARLMTSKEFLNLACDVRLGIALGYIENVSPETITSLMIAVSPATLSHSNGGLDEASRDRARASIVRERLS